MAEYQSSRAFVYIPSHIRMTWCMGFPMQLQSSQIVVFQSKKTVANSNEHLRVKRVQLLCSARCTSHKGT